MKKPPAFQFYARDWLADGDVMAMTLEQRGAYIHLLAYQWCEGYVPDDSRLLVRILGCSRYEFARIWPKVSAKFPEVETTLPGTKVATLVRANPRLRSDQAAHQAYILTQQQSAIKRWRSHKTENALALQAHMHSQCSASASSSAIKEKTKRNETPSADSFCLVPDQGENASLSAGNPSTEMPRAILNHEELFQHYPNNANRAYGLKCVKAKIRTAEDFSRVKAAVLAYSEKVKREGTEKKFIPHFSTWINREMWRDYEQSSTSKIKPNRGKFLGTPTPENQQEIALAAK